MKDKAKIIILSGIVFFTVMSVIIYKQLERKYSAETTIETFFESIKKKDAKKVSKLLKISNGKAKVSKQTVRPMIDYFEKNPEELQTIERNMLATSSKDASDYQSSIFTLTKVGRKIGFPIYKLAVSPQYIRIDITDTYKNLVVNYGGRSLSLTKDGKVGPVIPGLYKLNITYDGLFYNMNECNGTVVAFSDESLLQVDQVENLKKNKDFQQEILKSLVTYYVSENEMIRNGFDSGKLKNITTEYANYSNVYCELMKEFVATYERTFSGMSLNLNSMNVKRLGDQYLLTLDCFVDQIEKVEYKKELTLDATEVIESIQSGVLTMVYDEKQHQWLLSEIDYTTYQRDPKEWENKLEYKMKEKDTVKWENDSTKNKL